ncbi:MAG: electron transfer flavoprotein subunit alpha/FixB family protein, partial [Pseudomonadales bacterium]|nr:electron transfer flavoprotein subunit alpha/FixB family protein [Pseudomonadales bacterium]
MAILLFAEHDNATLSEQTAKALSAAAQIGGDVDILVAGAGVSAVAEQASKLAGVRSVLVAEDDALANHLAENAANLIVSLAGDYDTIVAAATANGKNILPRVAALLDVMQVSEVMEVVDADTFKRPIYAGNAIEVVQSTDAKKVLTIRTSSFGAVEAGDSVAGIKSIDAGSTDNGKSSFLENILSENDRPELGSAKIIVSGGRALGS